MTRELAAALLMMLGAQTGCAHEQGSPSTDPRPVPAEGTDPAAEANSNMGDHHRSLASELIDTSYEALLLRADHGAIDDLWARYPRDAFVRLLSDPAADPKAVFLAAEIGFYKDRSLVTSADPDTLARAYSHALAENLTGVANPWGLPDEIGPVGRHLMSLGQAAIPHLMDRLEDETPMAYGGSEAATLGNGYRYRVKDIAAFYLSRIATLVYPVHRDPAQRDVEIRALAGKLAR
jgi:hypothetical protein